MGCRWKVYNIILRISIYLPQNGERKLVLEGGSRPLGRPWIGSVFFLWIVWRMLYALQLISRLRESSNWLAVISIFSARHLRNFPASPILGTNFKTELVELELCSRVTWNNKNKYFRLHLIERALKTLSKNGGGAEIKLRELSKESRKMNIGLSKQTSFAQTNGHNDHLSSWQSQQKWFEW